MTRHHVDMLLTRNLPFESEARQWTHPLMISLHCLWAKSNNRTRGQFEYDVTWFCFCFNFVRSHARWKEVKRSQTKRKESQTRLMSWYWKRKPTWRKDLITYNSYSWIMFLFNWLIGEGRGVRLKLDVQGQVGGRILDVDGQGRWGFFENWTILMDVIRVSSLI